MDNQKLQTLLASVGKVEPVRTVAKNMSKGIIQQFNLSNDEKLAKAIEEAFVRGANWRLLQENKKNREKVENE